MHFISMNRDHCVFLIAVKVPNNLSGLLSLSFREDDAIRLVLWPADVKLDFPQLPSPVRCESQSPRDVHTEKALLSLGSELWSYLFATWYSFTSCMSSSSSSMILSPPPVANSFIYTTFASPPAPHSPLHATRSLVAILFFEYYGDWSPQQFQIILVVFKIESEWLSVKN